MKRLALTCPGATFIKAVSMSVMAVQMHKLSCFFSSSAFYVCFYRSFGFSSFSIQLLCPAALAVQKQITACHFEIPSVAGGGAPRLLPLPCMNCGLEQNAIYHNLPCIGGIESPLSGFKG